MIAARLQVKASLQPLTPSTVDVAIGRDISDTAGRESVSAEAPADIAKFLTQAG